MKVCGLQTRQDEPQRLKGMGSGHALRHHAAEEALFCFFHAVPALSEAVGDFVSVE